MARVLLSGFRLRLGDENNNPPDTTWRLYFTDSSTTGPKEVFSGPDEEGVSLGAYVDLDAQGYGPHDGIWLGDGLYNIQVQSYISGDPLNPANWAEEWTINKVQGSTAETIDTMAVRVADTVAAIRALSGSALMGGIINTGYYTLGDGGQGFWRWVASSTAADDGGSVLKPSILSTSQPGRWFRVFETDGEVSVKLWGAVSSASDVSGNLENAKAWAARISLDTGATLCFPAGKYSISGTILFDGTGSTGTGGSVPVGYHIHEGAVFGIPNLSVAPVFLNQVRISSSSAVCLTLALTDTDTGYADPRWWGAVGDGIADDSTSWNSMVSVSSATSLPRYGWGTIRVDKPYFLESATGGVVPVLDFGWNGSITYGVSATGVNIAKIVDNRSKGVEAKLRGNYAAVNYEGREFSLYWTKPTTSAQLLDTIGMLAASPVAPTVYWDDSFTFDADYTDPVPVSHVLLGNAEWNIGDRTVTVGQVDAPNKHVFKFGSSAIGRLNITGLPKTVLASWFGVISGDATVNLQHLFRQISNYGYSVDFGGRQVSINNTVGLSLPSAAKVRLNNLYLTLDGASANISVTGASNARFVMADCELDGASDNIPLSVSDIFEVRLSNVVTKGNVVLDKTAGSKDVVNCRFIDGSLNLIEEPSPSRYTDTVVSSCHFENAVVTLTNATDVIHKAIRNVCIVNNVFTNRGVLTNDLNGFIRIQATGIGIQINKVVIRGNTYANYITSGWDLGKTAVNVQDLTTAPNTWLNETGTGATPYSESFTWHNLVIMDEVAAAQPSRYNVTDIYSEQWLIRILLTEGISPLNREAPSTNFTAKAVNAFRLNGVLSSRCESLFIGKKRLPTASNQFYLIDYERPETPWDGAIAPDGDMNFKISAEPSRLEAWFHFRISL